MRQFLGLIILGFVLALLWRSPAQAFSFQSPRLSMNYVYYSINGFSVEELNQQMFENSPLRRQQNWTAFAAATSWHVRWQYDYSAIARGCQLKKSWVEVEIQTTLPHWDRTKPVNSPLLREWQRYSEALNIHEKGHQQNASAAGEAVKQFLETLETGASCQVLIDKISMAARQIIAEYRQRDRDYDRQTQHGLRQGAILNRTTG